MKVRIEFEKEMENVIGKMLVGKLYKCEYI